LFGKYPGFGVKAGNPGPVGDGDQGAASGGDHVNKALVKRGFGRGI
jgi:hypothetical protein